MSKPSKGNKAITLLSVLIVLAVAAAIFVVFNSTAPQEAGDAFLQATYPQEEDVTEPITEPETMPPELDDPEYSRRWDNEELDALLDTRPRSQLTGLPINEEYLNRRPIATVINNIHAALPQSGIAQADIIYEVLAEGRITRFVTIHQSQMPEMLGPVRSTRNYFVDIALGHDAIFVHHGGSQTGYSQIRNTGATNLDGMQLEGTVFWRDRTYPAWHFNTGTRPMEHSSFTSWERIQNHVTARNIRDTTEFNFGLTFGVQPAGMEVSPANTIRVPFSDQYVRTFVFDPALGLYMVYNQHGPHQDGIDAQQLGVANVLVQLTSIRVVDNEGRRAVQTTGTGSGYFATGGNVVPVTWARENLSTALRWYYQDGTPLILTPGRTWVNIFQGTVEFDDEAAS